MSVTRRDFLKAGLSSAGGLLLTVSLPAASRFGMSSAQSSTASQSLTAFVEIATDGTVTITAPRPETGQGVITSMPMLIAEELEIGWERVRVRLADDLQDRYGAQFTGGSYSVHESWMPLRWAGATARRLLEMAAAEAWGVKVAECRCSDGRAVHPASGRSLAYEKLVHRAAELPVPEHVDLKDPKDFRIIGTPQKVADSKEIVRGGVVYGSDVRVPEMLKAVIARSPVIGGAVRHFDASATLAVSGVRKVVELKGTSHTLASGRPIMVSNGIAVVADNTWAALKGRKALKITWEEGKGKQENTEELKKRCRTLASRPPQTVLLKEGDVEQALAGAKKRLEAFYSVPFVEAAPMEPMNCTARFDEDSGELWVPAQNPYSARAFAGSAVGIPPPAWRQNIRVHISRIGGGFGRRLDTDYAPEAALVSKAVGRPVQVLWTREDEVRHSLYRTMGVHHLRAGIDEGGKLTAWSHQLANPSRYVYAHGGDAQDSEIYADDFPAHCIPHFLVGYTPVDSMIPRGYFRSMVHSSNNFVIQSFLDEAARAAGRDPLHLRLELLGAPRDIPYASHGGPTYNTGRLKRVLEIAAEKGNWGKALAAGRGRGLACGFVFGTYVAEVAEVSVDGQGRVRVQRVTAAVDCGTVINPNGVRAQVEGAVIDGISLALLLEISVAGGRVEQGNFDDYPRLRISQTPQIEVHIVKSSEHPFGMGEIGTPPAVSAVANAICAATGKRIRHLPIRPSDLAGKTSGTSD